MTKLRSCGRYYWAEFSQMQTNILANSHMCSVVHPACTFPDSPGLFPTCENILRAANFLMLAACVNELVLDFTLNWFSWHRPEFMCDRGYSKHTCLCFCHCCFVVWSQLVRAHHLLLAASQLKPVPLSLWRILIGLVIFLPVENNSDW